MSRRHDDHVVLGAAETLHALAVRAAAPVDVFGDRRRADEADGLDVRIVDDRVHALLVAVHDIEMPPASPPRSSARRGASARRDPALDGLRMKALPQAMAGASFPHRDHGREVEGRDARHHAERLAHRIDVDAGPAPSVNSPLSMCGAPSATSTTSTPRWISPLASGIVLPCSRAGVGELVVMHRHELQELHQHTHAPLRIDRGPGRLRRLGVGDGFRHLRLRGERHLAAQRAVHRLPNVREAPDLPAKCFRR